VVKENVIKRVMTSLKCGVCQQRYEPDNVTVLGHEEDLWFLRVFCPACHTQYLVAVVIKEGKTPEVITDLTEAELDKFNNTVGLTADEVLDMHNFLKDFDGDFPRLFGRE
jgi:hypothetical protein